MLTNTSVVLRRINVTTLHITISSI